MRRDPPPSQGWTAVFAQSESIPTSGTEPEHDIKVPEAPDSGHSAVVIPIGPQLLPDPPSGWADALTGLNGPDLWERIVAVERARVRRYKRPVTIAFAEIVGLDDLARQWGREVGHRTLAVVAGTLAKEARSSDLVARIDSTRFGILLTETTEIAAINFIERARAACDMELAAASDLLRIAFGWASPPPNRDLMDAVALANDRLRAEIEEAE